MTDDKAGAFESTLIGCSMRENMYLNCNQYSRVETVIGSMFSLCSVRNIS